MLIKELVVLNGFGSPYRILLKEVLLQVVANDYAVLKQFRGRSSLATYLTVIARRICVHQLAKLAPTRKALS